MIASCSCGATPDAYTNCQSEEPHRRYPFFHRCLLNAQCQTFLRDEAQRCLANKSAVHSARLLHRYGTSVTSEVDVEQLRRDPLPGHPALPHRLYLPLPSVPEAHQQPSASRSCSWSTAWS